jgi:hypothetical protein
MTDYLWDKQGPRDPDIVNLERLLEPFGQSHPPPPLRMQDAPGRRLTTAGLVIFLSAAAAVIALVAVVWRAPSGPVLSVTTVAGTPRIGSQAVDGRGDLYVGGWLETNADAKATVDIGDIGRVDVDPHSRVSVLNCAMGSAVFVNFKQKEGWAVGSFCVYGFKEGSVTVIHDLTLTGHATRNGLLDGMSMDDVIKQTGFSGPLAEFLQVLRTDPRFARLPTAEVLPGFRDIAKRYAKVADFAILASEGQYESSPAVDVFVDATAYRELAPSWSPGLLLVGPGGVLLDIAPGGDMDALEKVLNGSKRPATKKTTTEVTP